MAIYVTATEAAQLLNISKETLYAYVSRKRLDRITATDGRTSLYIRDQVLALASRGRKRNPVPPPTIDIRISSRITKLDENDLHYRGHPTSQLLGAHSFESIAELLWTGELPESEPTWQAKDTDLAAIKPLLESRSDPTTRIALAAHLLAANTEAADTLDSARRLLAVVPPLFGGQASGSFTSNFLSSWITDPTRNTVHAVSTALVLLADHELATSTLAVRLAASVRTDPLTALAVGLGVAKGKLHGATSAEVVELFRLTAEHGPEAAVANWLDQHRQLPGFRHAVYRRGDPRLKPLLTTIRGLPNASIVDEVLLEAGRVQAQIPNIDLGLGALIYLTGLPSNCPLLPVARIAGWIAHYAEEINELPLRYRAIS